jgi:hypothetical protein
MDLSSDRLGVDGGDGSGGDDDDNCDDDEHCVTFLDCKGPVR